MLENLDEIIDHNLRLILESKNNTGWTGAFKDLNNKTLNDSQRFAEIIQSKDIIDITVESWNLTEFGFKIASNGGWIKYLRNLELARQNSLTKQDDKEKLEADLNVLRKERLEHDKTIRAKNTEIQNLQRDNLRLKNWDIRFRWYIAFITFVVGLIIKHFVNK